MHIVEDKYDYARAEYLVMLGDKTLVPNLSQRPNITETIRKWSNLARFVVAYETESCLDDELMAVIVMYVNTDLRSLYIPYFVVQEKYRGHGVGREMINYLQCQYGESMKDIRLEVSLTNEGACQFYSKLGFLEIESRDSKSLLRRPISETQTPLVVIRSFVYNHEPYLRKCLDGFVMQQTNFRFVAIVHDDCSTDSSASILKEYAEKYPDIIYPMYEDENLYSKDITLLRKKVEEVQRQLGAKYIAICEGDDCWTDPLKLQKQVDFLESHSEYSVCWHDFSIYNTKNGVMSFKKKMQRIQMVEGGCDVTVYDYLHGIVGGQPLTMLYRADLYDDNWRNQYQYFRDVHFIYLLLQKGKGYFMNFNGAMYHKHSDSATNSISIYEYSNLTYKIIRELYIKHKSDKVLADYLKDVMLWNYQFCKKNNTTKTFWRNWRKDFLVIPKICLDLLLVITKRFLLRRL